jgi:hypothetical protein
VPCAASARRRPGLPACHLHLHLPADCTSPMLAAAPPQHQGSMSGTMQAPCLQAGSRFEHSRGNAVLSDLRRRPRLAAGWPQGPVALDAPVLPAHLHPRPPKLGRSGEAYWRPLPQAACLPLMPAASRSCRRAVWGLLQPASQPGWHVMSTHKVMGAVTVGQAVRMGAGGLVGPLRVAGLMRVAGTNPAQPPAWPPWVHEACRLGRARWLMAPDHDGAAAGGWHTQGMTQGA